MTWTPTSAGQTLTSAIIEELASYSVIVSATKASDTSRNTTTTVSADPELSIVLAPSRTYEVGIDTYVTSAANAAGDFKWALAWTNTATLTWGADGLDGSLASGVAGTAQNPGIHTDGTSPTAETSFGASTSTTAGKIWAIVTTGGSSVTLTLHWAQLASNANNTTLLAGSRLWARRIA